MKTPCLGSFFTVFQIPRGEARHAPRGSAPAPSDLAQRDHCVQPAKGKGVGQHRLDPRLAPVKAAVLPLSKSEDLVPRAEKLAETLRARQGRMDAGALGQAYACVC